MAFGSYKTIGAVVKEFQITYTESDFVEFALPLLVDKIAQ